MTIIQPGQEWIRNELAYLDLLQYILENGTKKEDRTGTGTISIFGAQMRFDLKAGFPILTSKRISFKNILAELLWILSGDTNVKKLQRQNVKIWDEWADERGDLGPVYGSQWRNWMGNFFYRHGIRLPSSWKNQSGFDQINHVIAEIKRNPDSRRHIVTAWNPFDLPAQKLPPCHVLFQFYVEPLREGEKKRRLSCQLYQRSGDMFLGIPYNIASYALLTHIIAQLTDLDVGEFIHTIGDAHIYLNHVDQVKEQLSRGPSHYQVESLLAPTLVIDKGFYNRVHDFKFHHFHMEFYRPYPEIKAPVSV